MWTTQVSDSAFLKIAARHIHGTGAQYIQLPQTWYPRGTHQVPFFTFSLLQYRLFVYLVACHSDSVCKPQSVFFRLWSKILERCDRYRRNLKCAMIGKQSEFYLWKPLVALVVQVRYGPGKVPPIRRYNTSVLNSNQPEPFHRFNLTCLKATQYSKYSV